MKKFNELFEFERIIFCFYLVLISGYGTGMVLYFVGDWAMKTAQQWATFLI